MKYFSVLIILLAAIFSATAEEAPQNPVTNEVPAQNVETNEVTPQNVATNGVLPDNLLKLSRQLEGEARIFLVKDDDVEVRNKEFFVFRFRTFQNDKNQDKEPFNLFEHYRLKVTVQLKDRRTRSVVFAHHEEDVAKKNPKLRLIDYEGTQWEFRIPFGEMQKPKLDAYAIEFGFVKDGYFVPLSVDLESVDSADEILNGEGEKVEIERELKDSLWDR